MPLVQVCGFLNLVPRLLSFASRKEQERDPGNEVVALLYLFIIVYRKIQKISPSMCKPLQI